MNEEVKVPEDKPVVRYNMRKRWTPKMLAMYIIENNPGYAYLDPVHVMKKFPFLERIAKTREKAIDKLNTLMNHKDFDTVRYEWWLKNVSSKKNLSGLFWTFLIHLYEANMKLPNPSTKVADILGVVSGEYNPTKTTRVEGSLSVDEKNEINDLMKEAHKSFDKENRLGKISKN